MHKLLFAGAALALAGTAMAQPVTRTQTHDGPNYEATRTTTVDPAAGTARRQGQVTRKADGAVATRDVTSQRTETGRTTSGTVTNFEGQTRNWDVDRTRTADGYTASGTATGFDGQNYGYAAGGRRTADGYSRNRTLTDSTGAVVADRQVRVGRANGQVSRQTSSTRPQGPRRRR